MRATPEQLARRAFQKAKAVIVTTGAGMGVDSGLPDFRGPEGFWRAYPALRDLDLSFEEIATPMWFERDPRLAWGFYGHRLNLYRQTRPHEGYTMLQEGIGSRPHFALTTNVDNALQKSGWPPLHVYEMHGRINTFQCTVCDRAPWDGSHINVKVGANLRAIGKLPTCPDCGSVARPNIMMFNDPYFDPTVNEQQRSRYRTWLSRHRDDMQGIVVVEIGAGKAIPTLRRMGAMLEEDGATLIRINLRESEGSSSTISLPTTGLRGISILTEP